MLRGFYTAASGMMAQQRYQEALGNNIANMNTPGFKADQATIRSFPEMLIQAQGNKQLPTKNNFKVPFNQTIGSINTGVYVQEFVPDFAQGDIRETGIGTDLALVQVNVPDENGGLFFRVQNEAGEERLTRNGNFTIDGDGYLVTNQGYYVLSSTGEPIQPGGPHFNVTDTGILQAETQTVPLGIAYTADVNGLIKEGDNLYAGEAGAVPAGAEFNVRQGFLEGSNVDAARTMTEMMNAYRSFELNQRVLKAYDESLGKAVSEIGRLG
ncbi:flagellar hook-basal body protein [Oceanobacillus luteolus]|uniref:Flagellar hook-basal body protein n=1 Tax=Oceanobacillus luteolus TaxID=1274358 RepID=A0ABW4HM25_9BACI